MVALTTAARLAELQRHAHTLFRKDDPVLDENGRIAVGGMWPGQRRFWALPNFIKGFVGGYGAGKTNILTKRAIAVAAMNNGIPVWMVSPTYGMAQDPLVPAFEDALEGQAVLRRALGQTFEWDLRRAQPFQFTFRHVYAHPRTGRVIRKRGAIRILSGDKPDRLKGGNPSAAYMDEPFIQSRAVFDQLHKRVRNGRSAYSEIALAGTPEGMNWGYDLFEGDLSETLDVGLARASTSENLANRSGYVEDLLSALDDVMAASYVHGEFVNLTKGLVYYGFNRTENVVPLSMPDGALLGAGIDFNVNPMSAAVFWHRPGPEPHIHFFDEIELPNSDTPSLAAELTARYGEPGWVKPYCVGRNDDTVVEVKAPLRDVYPDPAGRQRRTNAPAGMTDFKFLEMAGLRVNAYRQATAVRDRENAVNAMLRPSSGRVRLTFAPWCKHLIKYMLSYTAERKGKTDTEAMSHLLEARDYAVQFLYPLDREAMRQLRLHGV